MWLFVVVMLLVVVERLVAVVVVVDEIAMWDCGGLPMVDYHCAVTWVAVKIKSTSSLETDRS